MTIKPPSTPGHLAYLTHPNAIVGIINQFSVAGMVNTCDLKQRTLHFVGKYQRIKRER